jgi:hydrogenase/urease accessory protein HupE
MGMLKRALFTLLLLAVADLAQADVFRPAYLELRESGVDRYEVLWKLPVQGDTRLGVQVRFPDGTTELPPRLGVFTGNVHVQRWQVSRPGGFAGQTLAIDGIASGVTDVIVRVERADGTSQVERLLPQRPEFTVQAASGALEVARSYLVLGVGHILGGVDHLLFVLALLLIVRGGRGIFITVTAFTVAHSITLVAATLGWVRVPGPPVEAMIALSIVYVAAEAVHGLQGKPGLTARAPWVVAFSFGLLLMFNVGVEIGQLIFVACMLGARAILIRLAVKPPQWVRVLPAYAIGTVAMFWVVERIGAFWG